MSEEIMDLNLEEMEEASGGAAKPYGDGTRQYVKHTVVRGNTLSGLANRYNSTVKSIMKLNPIIKDKSLIRVGWVLTIRCNDR